MIKGFFGPNIYSLLNFSGVALLYILFFIQLFEPKSRITNAEATVAPKPNQGTNPKWRCNPFRGSFFVSFLEKQKRKHYSESNNK